MFSPLLKKNPLLATFNLSSANAWNSFQFPPPQRKNVWYRVIDAAGESFRKVENAGIK